MPKSWLLIAEQFSFPTRLLAGWRCDPETMAPLAMESRSPHRNDVQPADIGMPVYYGLRWINSTGEAGPWSPIYSANVPG